MSSILLIQKDPPTSPKITKVKIEIIARLASEIIEQIIQQRQQAALKEINIFPTSNIKTELIFQKTIAKQLETEFDKPVISEEFKNMTTEEVESKFNITPQTLDLKEGEWKELDEGMIVKKDKNGILKIYLVEE